MTNCGYLYIRDKRVGGMGTMDPNATRNRRTPPRPSTASTPEVHAAMDVLTFARERLGFEPDALQARVLAASSHRGILCCTRQWGKSTVTALLAVHRAFTCSKSLTLVSSPGQRQR